MDFFAQQRLARRNTVILAIGYLLGISAISTIFAYAFYFAIWIHTDKKQDNLISSPNTILIIGLIFTLIFILITVVKYFLLANKSGYTLALEMGAMPLRKIKSPNYLETRLQNVVEEMAIASGMRLPSVLIIEEPDVNAFVIGDKPSNCALVVTRGIINLLNRNELQAVIGHEFSHILSGDIVINYRMISALYAFTFIYSLGIRKTRRRHLKDLFKSQTFGSGEKVSELTTNTLFSIVFVVIGSIGVFFSRIIKALISRQREYLADAASVQFTRNPESLAGALHQIEKSKSSTDVNTPSAEAYSHMFFLDENVGKISAFLNRLFATHPPIIDRIYQVYRNFNARDYDDRRANNDIELEEIKREQKNNPQQRLEEDVVSKPQTFEDNSINFPFISIDYNGNNNKHIDKNTIENINDKLPLYAETAKSFSSPLNINQLANLNPGKEKLQEKQIAFAVEFTELLKSKFGEDFHQKLRATVADGVPDFDILLALMLSTNSANAKKQILEIYSQNQNLAKSVLARYKEFIGFPLSAKMALIDLILPDIRTSDNHNITQALKLIQQLSSFEKNINNFTLLLFIESQIDPAFHKRQNQYIKNLPTEVNSLLSIVALIGSKDKNLVQETYMRGKSYLAELIKTPNFLFSAQLLSFSEFNPDKITDDFSKLSNLHPTHSHYLLSAIFEIVNYDGQITNEEYQQLRMIMAIFNLPMFPTN